MSYFASGPMFGYQAPFLGSAHLLPMPAMHVPTEQAFSTDGSIDDFMQSLSAYWNAPRSLQQSSFDGSLDFVPACEPQFQQEPPSEAVRSSWSTPFAAGPKMSQAADAITASYMQASLGTLPGPSTLPGLLPPSVTPSTASPTSVADYLSPPFPDGTPPDYIAINAPTGTTQLDGSMLGLYESIMTTNVRDLEAGGNDLSADGGTSPASLYRPPSQSNFQLCRRARSSFSSHRKAVQKSKSAHALNLSARERRATVVPSPIVVPPAPWAACSQGSNLPSSGPSTGFLTPPGASYLDSDPSYSGLKSPTKVLAYQARVRQQRSAMRIVIEDLRSSLEKVFSSVVAASDSPFLQSLRHVFAPLLDDDRTVSAQHGRSRASSRASQTQRPVRARAHSSTATSGPACQQPMPSGYPTGLSPWAQVHSSWPFDPARPTDDMQTQGLTATSPSPDSCFTELWAEAEDKSRSRQKNAYKQRLRTEELLGMEALSSLAKVVLAHVHSTPSSGRTPAETQALTTVKTAVWRHRAEWDLLLAAERRLGWGNSKKAKSEPATAMPSSSCSPDAQDFGVLVPFFFLSYPTANVL